MFMEEIKMFINADFLDTLNNNGNLNGMKS